MAEVKQSETSTFTDPRPRKREIEYTEAEVVYR